MLLNTINDMVILIICSNFLLGVVYAWGDEDCGKVRFGCVRSENIVLPKIFEPFNGIEIYRVFTGLQICAALTHNGSLFTWYLLSFIFL